MGYVYDEIAPMTPEIWKELFRRVRERQIMTQIEELEKQLVEAQAGRLESDIPLSSNFWSIRNELAQLRGVENAGKPVGGLQGPGPDLKSPATSKDITAAKAAIGRRK